MVVDTDGVTVAVEATTVVSELGWVGDGAGAGTDEPFGVTVVENVPVTTVELEPAALVVVAVTEVVTTTVEN